jgi:hypothetical protein
MGYRYRKSVKLGPFRATMSKSGMSYSAGVKGARVTKRADGRVRTTVSAPGTGLSRTSTTHRPAPGLPPTGYPPSGQRGTPSPGYGVQQGPSPLRVRRSKRSLKRRIAVAALILIAGVIIVGVVENGHHGAPPASASSSPPPRDAAKVGVPFLAHEGDASAEVTLTKITYAVDRPDGTPANAGEYAVLHLRIVGESAKPFTFNIESFSDQYTQEPDPYQPGDTNIYGVDPTDWSEFPQRLTSDGSVTKGKVVSGTIPLDVSTQSLLLINMYGTDGVTIIAQWLATSK